MKSHRFTRSFATSVALAALSAYLPLANANTFTVTRTNVSGAGSLLAAVTQANATPGDHVIEFNVSGTIAPNPSLPVITNNITINGRHRITLDGVGKFGLLAVGSNATVRISGLTLSNGYNTNGAAAISNAGRLIVEDCLVTGHRGTTFGGAIFNGLSGDLSLGRVTLSNNVVDPGWGGAVYSAGKLSISESTLVGNVAKGQAGQAILGDSDYRRNTGAGGGGAGFAGGLFIEMGSAAISNTTFSGNQAIGGAGGSASVHGTGIGGGPSGGKPGQNGGFGSGGGGVAGSAYTNTGNKGGFGAGDGGAYLEAGQGGWGLGAAVFVESGATEFINCTVCSNLCVAGAGGAANVFGPGTLGKGLSAGIMNYQGQVSLLNTIVANNDAPDGNPDLGGAFVSAGFNLIGNNQGATGLSGVDDYQNEEAGLGPLQDNGGATPTHALIEGSLAIDGGASQGAPATDQRGIKRPQGTQVDIGAFEDSGTDAEADSDGDGLTDQEETNRYHTDPSLTDTDSDGYEDGYEIKNQSDPVDLNVIPETLSVFAAVELEFTTNRGHQYQMEVSPDLNTWTPWGEAFSGAGGKAATLVSIRKSAHAYWRMKRVQ